MSPSGITEIFNTAMISINRFARVKMIVKTRLVGLGV